MNMNDVKFNWQSFLKFIIDLKSLMRIEMCILTKIVWTIKFSSFLTLTCSNLFFCFWLKFSLKIKRFSSHCRRLKEQSWNHRRHRCHIQCLLLDLKHLSFSCSCITAWWVWFSFFLRSWLIDFCTKRFYYCNDGFSWNIVCINRYFWFYRLIIAFSFWLIF